MVSVGPALPEDLTWRTLAAVTQAVQSLLIVWMLALGILGQPSTAVADFALPHPTDYKELPSVPGGASGKRYAGNQTAQIDALGRRTEYRYDDLGRRIRRILPEGMHEMVAYDATGRRTQRIDFSGRLTVYGYDVMGNLVNRGYGGASDSVTFTYHPGTSMRASVTDANGTNTFALTPDKTRIASKTGLQGTLNYTYDTRGNLTAMTAPLVGGNHQVSYQWDGRNHLATTTVGQNSPTTYSYDLAGQRTRVAYPNGTLTDYTYDDLGRITNVAGHHLTAGTSASSAFGYQRDAVGRRVSDSEFLSGAAESRTVSYVYDELSRLLREDASSDIVSDRWREFDYDEVGNRQTEAQLFDGQIYGETYDFDANDRIKLDQDSSVEAVSHTYDDNGNPTQTWVGQEGSKTLLFTDSYDFENRLIQRAYTDGRQIQFTYDADGNRVRKTVLQNGAWQSTTDYLVDTLNPTGYAQVISEGTTYPDSTQKTTCYVYGHDLIEMYRLGGAVSDVRYFGYDGHGNVRYLTDANGNVTDSYSYSYDAYGNLLDVSYTGAAATANNYLYAGEQFDADLGLYYLRARYYSPSFGRFWSMDTWEGTTAEPATLHKYHYARNNPCNRIDPSGNSDFSLSGVMAGMGARMSVAAVRIAPIGNRATIMVYEAVSGNTVIFGSTGAGVALASKMSWMGGVARTTWMRVASFLGRNQKVGTAKHLSSALRGTGQQANHLNQNAAFRGANGSGIPDSEGVAVALNGAVNQAGSEHRQFHIVLERFWRQFREYGSRYGDIPTNAEDDQAMRDALRATRRFADHEIDELASLAAESRKAWGFFDGPGGRHPDVPNVIPGLQAFGLN